jgi:hypothetical protein
METKPCLTCWATVPAEKVEDHYRWHDAIATVAIESTQRIDALTKRVQEIEASYGDR